MHFQHHSKPNIIDKDPDTRVEPIFVLGDKLPKRVRSFVFLINRKSLVFVFFVQAAQRNAKYGKQLPYDLQYLYFFIGRGSTMFTFSLDESDSLF